MSNKHGDTSFITLVVKMPAKPERQEFLEAIKGFIPKVHATEEGTELYALTRHPTKSHTYVWIERYRDAAAFDDHGKTPHMLEIRQRLPGWIGGEVEVQRLEQVFP